MLSMSSNQSVQLNKKVLIQCISTECRLASSHCHLYTWPKGYLLTTDGFFWPKKTASQFIITLTTWGEYNINSCFWLCWSPCLQAFTFLLLRSNETQPSNQYIYLVATYMAKTNYLPILQFTANLVRCSGYTACWFCLFVLSWASSVMLACSTISCA